MILFLELLAMKPPLPLTNVSFSMLLRLALNLSDPTLSDKLIDLAKTTEVIIDRY